MFLAVALLTFTPGSIVHAQSAPSLFRTVFTPANDVLFTLSPVKDKFGVGGKIAVNYRIENVSNHSLYVPRGWESTACLNIGPPHVWAWFENNAGEHFEPGYGVSCAGTPGVTPTLTERMTKGTVLVRPGEHVDGTLELSFPLSPGAYRFEAVLRGWKGDEFSEAELAELAKMGSPFLRGEVPASIRITLAR
jgi:hypothetical protein